MTDTSTGNSRNDQWEALVYLCRLGLGGQQMSEVRQPDWQKTDWDELLDLGRKHRIRPVLNMGLSLIDEKADIPGFFVQSLKDYQTGRGYENLLNARELIHLIKAMREKGMEVIPYKGVVLAQLAYGDIGLREMSDIDFLMELDKFPLIREILLGRGYVPSKHVPEEFETLFFQQNFEYNFDLYEGDRRKYHVEPHWKIGFRRWQTDLDFGDLKPLTTRGNFFGTEVNMLTPEGLLITTCLHHGGEDRWNSLKYICDVAAILIRFEKVMDWELLIKTVDKFKVKNIVLLGIGAAVSCFNAPVAGEIRPLINSGKINSHVQKVNSELRQKERSANINTYFKDIGFHFSLRQSPVTKLKVLYYHVIRIFTPTIYDINDEKSAGKKYWWLFITKPFRIWRTHVRTK